MAFQRGDQVEVSLKEEGFEKSYYLANIISSFPDGTFIVQFKTLTDSSGLMPLREFASIDQIRPLPPSIMVDEFSEGDIVDADHRDGWWTGKVLQKEESNYLVYFEHPKEEILFPFKKLRVHQEWNSGAWSYSLVTPNTSLHFL